MLKRNFIYAYLVVCLDYINFILESAKKGFLYLFTLGLFGIGWLYDTIRLGMRVRSGSLNIVSVETDIVYDDLDYYDALALRILYKSSGNKDKFLQAVKDHTSILTEKTVGKRVASFIGLIISSLTMWLCIYVIRMM